MTDRSTHTAVIGAGPVDMAVAKALLQHDIPYEQLEADDDLGGNWYRGVYDSAHIISSKKTTEYAEFPMPEHYPDFPARSRCSITCAPTQKRSACVPTCSFAPRSSGMCH